MKILLIEDDPDIASNVGQFFESKGHSLDYAYDGDIGLETALSYHFDIIILDLMLPNKDGIEVATLFRQQASQYTPIIMLTARDSIDDKLTGFSSGADDYLIKPFSLLELEARIMILHDRESRLQMPSKMTVADLELDPLTRVVKRAGKTIQLKPMAFNILKFLMDHTDRIISKQELLNAIWKDDLPEGDPLRVHIHNLRQQIDLPFKHFLIHTVHGIGYRLYSEEE